MCPMNDTCDRMNYYVIQQLPGEGATLLSADSVEESTAVNFSTKFINSITQKWHAFKPSILKQFASIILL